MKRSRLDSFDCVCEAIVAWLVRHYPAEARFFLQPVDVCALHLPSYPLIVQHPLHLGAVRGNSRTFAAQMRRVFGNAMLFNARGDVVYEAAALLLEHFERLWALWAPAQELPITAVYFSTFIIQ